ncbi:excalibur calcium-binding domain-containing protein [Streptomyces sp. NPDC048442]|uniref:excalibur calcium-binding domain-containing protein n=1 Tax=Streptomyces sp. NPDC048442 TaxID=3154823 RepID=UPI00343D0BF5
MSGAAVVMAVTLVGCGGGTPTDAKPVGAAGSTAGPTKAATPKADVTPSPAAATLGLVDDTASVMSVKPITVNVLANDTFTAVGGGAAAPFKKAVRKGAFTLSLAEEPSMGTAAVSADGSGFTYTPKAGFGGEDEFTYKVVVVTGEGGAIPVTGTAVVRLKVSAPKPAPVRTKKPAPKIYYKNCAAARAAGVAPIKEGQPGYGRHLDRDGDGVGCDSSSGGSGGTSGGGSGSGSGSGSTSGGSSSGGSSGGSVSYKNCSAVRAAGAAPIHAGDPGYGRHLDRDGDGVGCES